MPDEDKGFDPNIIFERRRFVRIKATFVVSYREIGLSEPKSDITQTKNISTGGFLFTTDRQFKPGAKLIVSLRVPDAQEYINIKTQVVDSVKRSKGNSIMCNTRIKFIGIREEDREAIKKIIEYNLENQQKQEG